ncbi:MAG: transposase, partial [Verrucomicrobia bacterium]|nr:transposase [Verrucomicrobiota bacterium]
PVRFVVTGGERNDITQAPALIPAGSAEVICDRGYDADWWRERLVAAGHRPVIPGRRNRLVQPLYDHHSYRSRHLVENAFARLKSARRIATRYDQTVASFSAFVSLACVFLWLM